MAGRVVLLAVLGFCLLQGGQSFEDDIVEKIENSINQLLTPLTQSKERLEEGLKKHFQDHSDALNHQKAVYLRILKTLPENCAPEAESLVAKFDAMDLDSCENLTYTIEEAHNLTIQGFNLSRQVWHDLSNVTTEVVKCPNINPILFARCVIKSLIIVRDTISEYKPVVLPYEEQVKENLIKMGREFVDCLNFKKDKANEVMRAAVARCRLGANADRA